MDYGADVDVYGYAKAVAYRQRLATCAPDSSKKIRTREEAGASGARLYPTLGLFSYIKNVTWGTILAARRSAANGMQPTSQSRASSYTNTVVKAVVYC